MKKLLKIVAWIVGAIAALLIVAIVGVMVFFPKEKAKALIVERGSQALGRPISVAAVDVSFWGGLGVVLRGVAVANPPDWPTADTMLTAEQIDVKLKLLPLLSGEYRLARLVIDRPVIVLHKTGSGAANYAFPVTDTARAVQALPEETRAAAVAVSFDRLAVNRGRLTYIDDSTGVSVALNDFTLSTALANPRANVFRSEGNLEIPQLVAVLEGTVPPFALGLRYRAEYDLGAKKLLLDDSRVRINQLNFALSGELSHGGAAPVARGHIASDQIAVRDLFSLLPAPQLAMLQDYTIEGDFALEADVRYDVGAPDTLDYSGSARISDMLLEYRQVPGQLRVPSATVDFKRDNARLNISDASFAGKPLKGYVYVENFAAPVVNAELTGEINLGLLRPFLPAANRPELVGDASFSVKASGPVRQVEELEVSGNVRVANGRYAAAMLPEPVESFSLDVYFDKSVVRVNALDARMPSGNLSFKGRVNDLLPYLMADSLHPVKTGPAVDGTLEAQVNLAMLNPFLPKQGKPEIAGKLQTSLQLAGDILEPSGLRVRGTLAVGEGAYRDTALAEPIEHFDTRMTIIPDTIRIDELNIRFTTSDLSLTGSLIDPFPYLLPLKSVDRTRAAKPFLQFAMTSHRFNVDSLFPDALPSGDAADGGPAAGDTLVPFILPDIDGRGVARFDTVIYWNVPFSDLTGDVTIKDRVVRVTNVVGRVYTGTVTGETSIDLNNWLAPAYDGRFNATDIEANDFARRFTRFGDFVYGKFNLDGSFQASGWDADAIMYSLNMNSAARMREGRLETSGAVLTALQTVGSLVGEQLGRTFNLRNARTDIAVDSGRVRFDKLSAALGDMGDLELNGFYSFAGEVNYTGTLLLSPELTQKFLSQGVLGEVSSFLGGSSAVKQVKLPVTIGGSLDDPKVDINLKSITEQAGKSAVEGAADKLKGLIKKP
ncbi:MAG TPA: AsmA-like C-terminal region-containing protein [candidate division Zixibacteria bacterium]|nr:AsmA-like C-terminal region-containing protein [candidate division Zixibacteria bacterium]HPI32267.1 AsmA-like C-terminal region-containing protein [candidate division Zixibacteria bacterium]HPM36223.1 AsmA-like C-terminal region-containing protein [candidate division Zixibacteria bacterium]